LIILYNIIFLN